MDVAVIDWTDSKFEKDVVYEDINAPQWIDFSNADDHHPHAVDDDAWFCRPECNHPKTVEDFFKQRTPGSSKLQRSATVAEVSQLSHPNTRDAALKKRGFPPKKDIKSSNQVHDGENQDPNFTTPPTHKSKSLKEMIKSSSEKNHASSPTEETAKPRLLKSTLSAHNLFAGREILNQVTEFCNELKRLATRTKEGMVGANKQEVGVLMKSKSERKPLLEVKKDSKFEGIEKQSGVKEKLTGKQTNVDSENSPISLNMKNIRGKGEERVLQLQIRTNPPSPQCFSAANHGTKNATPSKAFRLRPQGRGMLQEVENMEVKKEVKGSNSTIQSEAKGLDVFWFLKPCTLAS
ncbi:uncharacterized protein LOC143635777 [Bidens hawaiensis]|uniref:uncharacterized protein LOC143635777 n=1 Tax=Bidens hawaiensis TaxID=980011 RepID=UPI00404A2911